ncbi:MAG: InlB B-repeat-containing protein, partial [Bacteroidales bacterium]|nr:InlB B-repeat-containing protein [Bacteroidales bacterium]
DVEVTGSFSINSYTLTYKVDGETYGEVENVEYNKPLTLRDEPTREGYTFSGWSELPTNMPANDVEVTGSFNINSYTLTYKVDGETYGEVETVEYNKPLTLRETPTREGYTFSGWSELPTNMPANDVEVTGSFNINTYTLTYKVDGETYGEVENVEYNKPLTLRETPTKEGYTFSGWSELPTNMPAEDVEVTGSFSINSYTIKFINYDGAELQSSAAAYGEMPEYTGATPIKPADAINTYEFIGWSPEIKAVDGAAIYTAQFADTKNVYNITFQDEDGTVIETVKGVVGVTFTVPDAPVKIGHTFIGWSNLPETIPAEDITCKATYHVNQYTIIFEDIDGSVIAIVTEDYGAEIEMPQTPSKNGYTFDGWNMVIPSTMPAENLVVVVKWKDNAIKIKPKYVDTDNRAVADASNTYFCNGFAVINYEVLSGTPTKYTIDFDGGEIPSQRGLVDGKSVVIDLPKTLEAGSYNGTLIFTDDNGESSGPILVKVIVTLPFYTIVPLYDDVATVNAHAGDFTAYQWTENSQILVGETGRLLQRELNTSSVYTAWVTLPDGKQYETCPLDMSRFEGVKKRTMINVYPNPAVANSEITVEITQNYIPEAEKSITIYSLGGTLVQRISSPEQFNTIRLQGGVYSVVYVQNGEQVVFKLIVH